MMARMPASVSMFLPLMLRFRAVVNGDSVELQVQESPNDDGQENRVNNEPFGKDCMHCRY